MVGGATVTGVLIGNIKWFEEQEMLNSLAENLRSDSAQREAAQSALEKIENLDLDLAWFRAINDVSPVGYIHLRNARFFAGPSLVPSKGGNSDGIYWRCKLSDVSGWTLGSLGEGAPAEPGAA